MHQESDVAGYSLVYRSSSKSDFVWDRDYALKLIMIGCCIALTVKNFLLFFESIRKEICLNILHTLIVAAAAYLIGLNKKYSPN